MEISIENSLINGESIFKTIGKVLIQVQSNSAGGQTSREIDFKTLAEREATSENLEALITSLKDLLPEDVQAFADGLIGLGPEGAKLLESLIIKNRLNNFDLNGFSLSASQDFADGLIKLGPEGIKLLTTLIEQYRLENFDLSGLQHVDSITFADSLIKCRKIGTQCLKALIEHRRIPINFDLNGLSPIDSKTFACMLIECGPEGAEYLKFLVKQKRLSTLALSVLPHDDFKNFTKTLIECGPEGAECLRFLVEQKRLFPSLRALQPNQSQALTAQLIKLGPKGAECLRFLAEQNSLFPNLSALQPKQSKTFADGLILLGPEGAKCLRFLVEQNRLPTLVLSALQPNQSQAFANRLLKCGPEGAKCLRFLVEQKRLPTLVLSALPSDQSQAFEYRLLKCGPEGVEYLKFLVEQKRLPTLVLSALPHDNFKDFAKALIECGPEGTEYLKFLVEQNKGSASFTEEESQDLAEIFIHESKFGIECLKSWVGKGMLPNLKLCKLNEEVLLQFDLNTLPKEQVTGLAKALLDSSNPSDLSLLGRLIEWNKLSFDPNFKLDISLLRTNSNAFAVALAGGGAFSLALLAQLMDVSKGPTLDLSDLSYVSSQAFADRLLGCSSSGANFLVELIEQNKLPNLLFPEDMKARAIRFRDLHSTFEGGIKKAFFGKTDSIDYKSWTSIRTRLQDMSLGEARGIWRTITNEVAVNCFDADGNVDVEKLKGWMEFFGNVETFRTIPYRFIPIVELMRSQMYTVCECLVLDRNDVMKQLNAANSITVGQNGRFILAAISQGRQSLLSLTQAILASLFTPHRQNGLIACTIHSLINAEIRNHPERLIQIYIQMLNGNQFTFPSGYVVLQEQSIMDNFIIVDLQNGKRGRNEIFANMTSIDPSKVAQQREIWQQEGISVEAKYKLRMPVHNINDLLFAHLFQRSNFGNCEEYASDYGTTLIYAGHSERDGLFTQKIQVDESNFLDGIKKLKEQAETQRQNLGHRYMRVVTTNHAENIDIAALLALDLDNMETEKAYPIGDRNWCNRMSQDIPRLAFRKKGGEPPIYEWGTLRGHLFDPKAISTIHVFDTSIKVFSPITT
ncbi:MAG: hypothetical protein LBD34_03215 [Puniceicoccales bacterium]|nr:hypothetical protein [Puniceicoccales bacterium]